MSLLELMAAVGLLGVFLAGILGTLAGTQSTFLENRSIWVVQVRAQKALDRIVSVARQAVTEDADFSFLKPSTGVNSHGLQFRLLDFIDGGGQPVYDDTLRVFIYGPDSGESPSKGLIIGRGPDLATIHATGGGPDGFLGTRDDNTTAAISGGVPAVELLVPSIYAPRTGEMFTINFDPGSDGRLITFTLRLNVKHRDRGFVIPDDLVLTERVALMQ